MKVTCKTVGGAKFEVDAEASDTVKDLKSKVEASQGVEKFPADGTKLLCKGVVLQDTDTLESKQITEQDFLVVFPPKKAKPAPAAAPAATPAKETPKADAAAGDGTAAPTEASKEPDAPADMAEDGDATATATGGAPSAGGTTGAGAMAMGAELQASVKAIVEMGFPEEDVKKAMRAAFNNPDRAVEYLMTGIPETAEAPAAAAAGGGGEAPAAVADAPAQGTPAPAAAGAGEGAAAAAGAAASTAGAGATGPNVAPLDMWSGGGGGGGGAAAGGGATGGAPAGAGAAGGGAEAALAALQGNPQMMQQLSQMLASGDGNMMQGLQQLMRQNPQLAQAMAQDPAGMLAALGGGGMGGEEAEGALPPGAVQVNLTPEEVEAVQRLEALGFPRHAVLQAYLACEKQEELAANMLLNNMDEDE